MRIPSGIVSPLGGFDVVAGDSALDVVGIESLRALVAVLSSRVMVVVSVIIGIGPRE